MNYLQRFTVQGTQSLIPALLFLAACASTPKISQADIASITNGENGALLLSLETNGISCRTAEISLKNTDTDQTVQANIIKPGGKAPAFQILALSAGSYQIGGITCISHSEDSQFFYKETSTIRGTADAYEAFNISDGVATYPGTVSLSRERGVRSTARFDILDKATIIQAAASEQAPSLAARFNYMPITVDNTLTGHINYNRQHSLKPKPAQPKP